MAAYDAVKVQSLLCDSGIVRNRLKVSAAIANARAFLRVQREFGCFSDYIWRFVDYKPLINSWKDLSEVLTQTGLSEKISRDLKKRGFKFVGPTVVYAHMQATGMVQDHTTDCFRYKVLSHPIG